VPEWRGIEWSGVPEWRGREWKGNAKENVRLIVVVVVAEVAKMMLMA
jgi:hypothetical protein